MHLIGQELRLRGKNLTESEHVAPGAYHTLQIETQRAFTLEKALWDAVDLDRIQVACNPAARADLAAILITVRSRLHQTNLRRLLAIPGRISEASCRDSHGSAVRSASSRVMEGLHHVVLAHGLLPLSVFCNMLTGV